MLIKKRIMFTSNVFYCGKFLHFDMARLLARQTLPLQKYVKTCDKFFVSLQVKSSTKSKFFYLYLKMMRMHQNLSSMNEKLLFIKHDQFSNSASLFQCSFRWRFNPSSPEWTKSVLS